MGPPVRTGARQSTDCSLFSRHPQCIFSLALGRQLVCASRVAKNLLPVRLRWQENNVDKRLYQPHIDGLRTVAVLAVLWAHFRIPGLSGGFLGVDVFFVISGFLITRLILNEKSRTGRFSYTNFYIRRLRRLMPAALATIAVTLLAFYPILGDKDLVSFLRSVPFSIAPLANVNLYREIGYFDVEAQLKPLLHFWSLAVEEQFYFFWPTILLLVSRWPRLLHSVAIILLLASVALAQMWLTSDRNAAYYLLPARAFELMVGAVLAIVLHTRGSHQWLSRNPAAGWIALAGMAAIVASYAIFDEESPLPGLLSLVTCLGTAAVIAFGDSGPVGRFLKSRPIVWIGLISYSLYLVHWPIYVYVVYRLPEELTIALRIALVPISIALAAASYYLIERPFRHPAPAGKRWGNMPFIAASLAVACLLVVPTAAHRLFPEPQIPNYVTEIAPPVATVRTETRKLPFKDAEGQLTITRFVPSTADPVKILVIGDSHADHLKQGLLHTFASQGYLVDLASSVGCPPLFGVTIQREDDDHPDLGCVAANSATREVATSGDHDIVVLASRWSLATGDSDVGGQTLRHIDYVAIGDDAPVLSMANTRALFESSLARTVGEIRAAGARVILMGQVPPTGSNLTRCQALFSPGQAASSTANRCAPLSQAAVRQRLEYSNTRLAQEADGQSVIFIDSEEFFCGDGSCRIRTPQTDEILYTDDNHLTAAGSLFYLNNTMRSPRLQAFLRGAHI